MKLKLSIKAVRNIVIALVVAGLLFLSMAGYLTSFFNFSTNPLIRTQSWLTERYTAFRDFFNSPRDMATLREQNSLLQSQLAQAQGKIIELQESLSQIQIVTGLMEFARANPEHTYVPANVIGREISPYRQYIIIDIGSSQGVQHGMPVVTDKGLVGRIDAVISNAARVELITDANSVVNVRLQNANVEAQVRGSLMGEANLGLIPQGSQVQIGDVILTSGLGGNYPPNIFVGQVLSMDTQQNTLFQSGSVQPVVDFEYLSAVMVITNFNRIDISPLVP
ncbi:MAG: rod shape-determining protein MreC [Anaerolineaceae bacterium]|nr:rod shape-determining protein MreC [Anaerolineaceae bacterium]